MRYEGRNTYEEREKQLAKQLSLGNEFSLGREGPKRLRSSGAQAVTLVETEDEVEGVSEGS